MRGARLVPLILDCVASGDHTEIAKVLLAQPFAPLLPSNATLANMTDAEYDTALDTWTVAAKKAPFTDPFLI